MKGSQEDVDCVLRNEEQRLSDKLVQVDEYAYSRAADSTLLFLYFLNRTTSCLYPTTKTFLLCKVSDTIQIVVHPSIRENVILKA